MYDPFKTDLAGIERDLDRAEAEIEALVAELDTLDEADEIDRFRCAEIGFRAAALRAECAGLAAVLRSAGRVA